jgi:hypothetical protein
MLEQGKEKDSFDLSAFQIIPETSRASYFCYSEIVANYCFQTHDFLAINTLVIVHHKVDTFSIYLAVKNQNHFREVLEKYLENPRLLNRIERHIEDTSEQAIQSLVKKNLTIVSGKELGEIVSFCYLQNEELAKAAMTLRLLDHGIINYFKDNFPSPEGDELVNILSVSDRQTFATQEYIALLNVAVKLANNELESDTGEYETAIKNIHPTFAGSRDNKLF